jgi:hypothetical protein
MTLRGKGFFFLALTAFCATSVHAQQQYASNPYVIPVEGTPHRFGDRFFAADLDRDGRPDYTYRTQDSLYVYDHDGAQLYKRAIHIPTGTVNGNAHVAADIDGDGYPEVLALDSSNHIIVFEGATGDILDTVNVAIGSDKKIAYIAAANFRGHGDRDVLLQAIDKIYDDEGRWEYYLNRTIIAYNMEADPPVEMWSQPQDRTVPPTGYWGQAHGAPVLVDVDGDGRDEVVGGTLIDHDGQKIPGDYSADWVDKTTESLDHIDGIAVGDFLPGTDGLEWVVTQEDWIGKTDWHTALISMADTVWRRETTLFPGSDGVDNDREPQNIAVGDFDPSKTACEVFCRSRFNGSETHTEGQGQHPWVFDWQGIQFSHYNTVDSFPSGFNTSAYGNKSGIECVWTIDWDGGSKEYIAANAREVAGNTGIFNPVTGQAVWTTMGESPAVQAKFVYVADVSGDSREEVILYDQTDHSLKIFWNGDSNPDPGPRKWDDPLYRRLKMHWNYYSPGGYTRREPCRLQVKVFLQGAYSAAGNAMTTQLKDDGFMPLVSPYPQDTRVVSSIPAGVTDWVLIQLRTHADSNAVVSRSAFVRSDGQVVDESGEMDLNLFVQEGNYYIVVRHRNHITVMSKLTRSLQPGVLTSYDFSTGKNQYYGQDAALIDESPSNVYGMVAADASGNDQVQNDDKNDYWTVQVGLAGYRESDFNLNGQVQNDDKNDLWHITVGKGTQVPEAY